ncbi:2-amino-4-hydroxy-6-hydroxymethyldihydropteridine diphosphokinase, partial [bacterium]|nr:2-amino-4-hydroxy-6-hydroxymethyldihydropteridine diphosphokinase [bacterium]
MSEALVLLGSNVEPERWSVEGVDLLGERVAVLAASRCWRTSAEGEAGQADYINRALRLEAGLDESGWRAMLREVETAAGRERAGEKFAPRTLDLDLVWLDGRWLQNEGVGRPYGILPLAEVAGNLPDPDGVPLKALAARLRRHP